MPYSGETLEVSKTLSRIHAAASRNGFTAEALVEQAGTVIPIYTRPAENSQTAPRVYISTGMHGDEPAGPLAILDLLETEALTEDIDWTIFPMMNPVGLRLNQRENHHGVDLNRDYKQPQSKEIAAHMEYIQGVAPWDLSLIVHEDWESKGFYLYDLPTELTHGWAPKIIDAVSEICPIDRSDEIDEMPARDGIIRPKFDNRVIDPKLKGKLPETLFLILNQRTQGTFTFETPSSFDLATRILAHRNAIITSLKLLKAAKCNKST